MNPSGSGTPEIVIPLKFDTTGMDAQIAAQEAKLIAAFNHAMGMGAKAGAAMNMQVMQNIVKSMSPVQQAQFMATSPQFNKAVNSYNQFAATGETDEDRAEAKRAAREQAQQLRELNRNQKESLNHARQQAQHLARGLAMGGQFATGNLSGLGRVLTSWATSNLATLLMAGRGGGGGGGSGGGGGGSAGTSGGSGGGASGGAINAAVNAAASTAANKIINASTSGAGATPAVVAQDAAGAPAGLGLLSKLGGIGIAVGAMAGVGVMTDKWRAAFRRQQYSNISNIAGSGGGTASMADMLRTAQGYIVDPNQVAAQEQQFGRQGMFGGAGVDMNTKNAYAYQRITGMDMGQISDLTATLAVKGQVNPEGIGRIFDTVVRGSKLVGISMAKLTDTLSSFETATNGTALTVKGATSLLGLQGYMGNRLNMGSIMSNMGGATGVQALQTAAVLGLTPDQLGHMQRDDQAGLLARAGTFFRRSTGVRGRNASQEQIDIAEAINSQLGLFNVQGMGVAEQNQLFGMAMNGATPQTLKAYMDKFSKGTAGANLKDLQGMGVNVAQDVTSVDQKAMNKLQVTANTYLDQINKDTDIMVALARQQQANFNGLPAGGGIAAAGVGFIQHMLQDAGSVLSKAGPAGIAALLPLLATGAALPLMSAFTAGEIVWRGGQWLGNTPAAQAILNDAKGFAGAIGNMAGGAINWAEGGIASLFDTPTGAGAAGGGPNMSGSYGGSNRPFPINVAGGGTATPTLAMMKYFRAASHKFGVPLEFLLAQSANESGFNPNALSAAGAMGLSQLMPGTFNEMANILKNVPGSAFYGKTAFNPYDPQQSIEAQAQYDKILYGTRGNWKDVSASYLYGPNAGANSYYNAGVPYEASIAADIPQIQMQLTVNDKTSGGVVVEAHPGPARINHQRQPKGVRDPAPKHPYGPGVERMKQT